MRAYLRRWCGSHGAGFSPKRTPDRKTVSLLRLARESYVGVHAVFPSSSRGMLPSYIVPRSCRARSIMRAKGIPVLVNAADCNA